MKIPEKIKISGYNHSVKRPEKSFVSDDTVCDGLYDFYKQEITVSKEGNTAYQQTVFFTS